MRVTTGLAAAAMLALATGAHAQAPSGPGSTGKAILDYFLTDMAEACQQVPDRAWAADTKRRIEDFVLRTNGPAAGNGMLLGLNHLAIELMGERMRSRLRPDAPTLSDCNRSDWDAIRARGEAYRRDRSLDRPRRR